MALLPEGYRVDMALTDCYSMVYICAKVECCYYELCTVCWFCCSDCLSVCSVYACRLYEAKNPPSVLALKLKADTVLFRTTLLHHRRRL